MKKSIIVTMLFIFLFHLNILHGQEISNVGALGVGVQATSLNYGISGRYNLTEVHGLQAILGSANYGLGGSVNAFTFSGRYLYSFPGENANLRPYVFGQLGFWTVKFNDSFFGSNFNESATSLAYGFGGGVEYAFSGLEKLGFNIEAGYGGGSFAGGFSYAGVFFGGGVHYYFDL